MTMRVRTTTMRMRMRVRVTVRVRVRAMIMMALALALVAIITCAGRVRVRVRAGAVTGKGHRLRHTGQCAAGYAAVSQSECQDIANAVQGYTWDGAGEDSNDPPGCSVYSSGDGSVFYNRRGVDGRGQDCSADSGNRCICACVSGRYSSSTTPADGECTACDSGKRFSTSVLYFSLILSLSSFVHFSDYYTLRQILVEHGREFLQ